MKITPEIWHQMVIINQEYKRRGENLSRTKISEVLKVNDNTAKCLMFAVENMGILTGKNPENEQIKIETKTEGPNYEIVSTSAEIRTLDELMAFCKVDLEKWKVKRHVVNSWGSLKNENFQVKAWLEEKHPDDLTIEEMAEKFENLIKKYKPKIETFNVIKRNTEDYMLKVGFYDQHHGQLSWAPEAGDNWDIKISKHSLLRGSKYFCNIANQEKVSRILYVAGNDFLNVNSEANTTAHGTPQDEDCRYHKSFETGLELLIRSINMFGQIAPVDVVIVKGNHDKERMSYLGIALKQYYRTIKYISVDSSPGFRKYYPWESNLIGLSHGDKENLADIPSIMAMEAKKYWAKAENFYFFHGHIHHEKKLFKDIEDIKKVQVEFDPSLVALNSWSKPKGFGAVRKSKAHLFHKKYGNVSDYRYFQGQEV